MPLTQAPDMHDSMGPSQDPFNTQETPEKAGHGNSNINGESAPCPCPLLNLFRIASLHIDIDACHIARAGVDSHALPICRWKPQPAGLPEDHNVWEGPAGCAQPFWHWPPIRYARSFSSISIYFWLS